MVTSLFERDLVVDLFLLSYMRTIVAVHLGYCAPSHSRPGGDAPLC